ncbi:MAG: DUF885 domain-containing protein [Acidobacteriota bacterium]|nr:DUF885 domain-containing protein [Acidobacteriota bacterium]
MVWLALACSAHAQSPWDRLVQRYADEAVLKFAPSSATSAGFHQWDTSLEDFSQTAIQEQTRVLRSFERETAAFAGAAPDRDLVLSSIRSTLLGLESIRMWEKNADTYSSTASGAAFAIMSRKYGPPEKRLESLIARERRMPNLFAQARVNLKNPPRVYTEVAIEQLPGIIEFFEKDVPLAFHDVKDQRLLGEFHSTNAAVLKELHGYLAWLRSDLLPRSNGDFRLGADNYRRKLLYDEMVDIPLDRLLQIGYDDLHRNQEAFRQTAKKIDPSKTPQQILDTAEKDHPSAGQLLQSFGNTLEGLRAYVVEHKLLTIPTAPLPILEETPAFARALTSASMDMPGPFEKVAKEAFFNVTLPDKALKPREVEEYLEGFNRGTIASTAIHEAYPGHYVQGLWLDRAPSMARKLLGANTYVEGWAHYCEQMMIDEGYGNGDLKLRLGQLQDALLRDARYVAAIQMHTGKMTMEQSVEFFVKEGFQTRPTAEKETKRGASDATYLYYTLGKLEILKLREDYRKLRGSAFTLQEFHDKFLGQGNPPIRVVRRAMLGNDSPVL